MKVTKQNIKKAIIIFWDREQNMYRRVIFGDSKELIDMLLVNGQILLERLQKLGEKEYNNPSELEEKIENSRGDFEKDNYHTTGENLEMEISYEVKDKNEKR